MRQFLTILGVHWIPHPRSIREYAQSIAVSKSHLTSTISHPNN